MRGLPIVGEGSSLRRSRNSRWRACTLIAVHLLIALHITHWWLTGRSLSPLEPSEAMSFTKAGILNAGAVFFAISILLTFLLGRLFCGWGCHLLALQDLSRWLLARVGIRPQPFESRVLRWVPFLAFAYMFLWPVVYRFRTGGSFTSVRLELTTDRFWASFPGWTVASLTFLICGFIIVYLLGSKSFCTYACPYGAAFSLADRFATRRIRVTDACQGCAHCTATCTSNVRVHLEVRNFGMVVDDGCLKTLDCVSVCPNQALYYGRGISRRRALAAATEPWRRRPPVSWPEELLLGLAFAMSFLAFRGLYGQVPFLLSLGWSAVLAFLALTTVRLLRRNDFSLRRSPLKREGRLQPAGLAYLTLFSGLALLWMHSGWIRYHQYMGERSFDATESLRHHSMDALQEAPQPSPEEWRAIRASRQHLEAAGRWGLLATPGNAWRRSWIYFLSGSPVQLEESAQEAIDLGEDPADIHHLLALAALQSQDLESARVHFELAIAAEPNRPEVHINYGLLEVQAGNLAAAEAIFERAVEQAGDSPEVAYNAGLANALTGDFRSAVNYFERALSLDPGHLAARENLAGVLAQLGRYAESERHYREAIRQSPDDAQTRLLLARVLAAAGDVEAALEQLDRCLELAPDSQEAIILADELEARR